MANAFTFLRIFLILPFAAAMFAPGDPAQWVAFLIFVAAGVTDFLDGYIARARGETSRLGAMLDPVADKLLAAAALLLLVMSGKLHDINILAALIILLREIWISGLREALAGRTIIAVSQLAKLKTTAQFAAIAILLLPWSGFVAAIGIALLWIAAVLTAITGYDYTRKSLPILKAEG